MVLAQDEDILRKHDYTEATESTVDVSLLPKVMQVRDFGKRSRTKYTHLLDQDTTVGTGGFGGVGIVKPGAGQGCFSCGGPHLKKGKSWEAPLTMLDTKPICRLSPFAGSNKVCRLWSESNSLCQRC